MLSRAPAGRKAAGARSSLGGVAFYPALVALFGLPLAWAAASPVLHTAVLAGIGLSLALEAYSEADLAWAPLLALSAAALLAFGLGEALRADSAPEHLLGVWRRREPRTRAGRERELQEELQELAEPATDLGVRLLFLAAFLATFLDLLGDEAVERRWIWLPLVGGVLLAGVAALTVAWRRGLPRGARRLVTGGIAGSFGLLWLALLVRAAAGPERQEILVVVLANGGALLLAVAGIYSGYARDRRRDFWPGMLLAVGLVVARFFQYDTSLLVKSVAFLAAGIVVLAVGIAFERHLRREERRRAPPGAEPGEPPGDERSGSTGEEAGRA